MELRKLMLQKKKKDEGKYGTVISQLKPYLIELNNKSYIIWLPGNVEEFELKSLVVDNDIQLLVSNNHLRIKSKIYLKTTNTFIEFIFLTFPVLQNKFLVKEIMQNFEGIDQDMLSDLYFTDEIYINSDFNFLKNTSIDDFLEAEELNL